MILTVVRMSKIYTSVFHICREKKSIFDKYFNINYRNLILFLYLINISFNLI